MEVLSEKWHKARKQHRCENGHIINQGEKYNYYQFIVDGGDNWGYKLCEPCHSALVSLYIHIGDPWDEGIVIEPTFKPGFITDGEYAANSDGDIFESIKGEWVEVKI